MFAFGHVCECASAFHDHWQIFNVDTEAEKDKKCRLAALLDPAIYDAEFDRHVKNFFPGSRGWLLKRFDDWLLVSKERAFIIYGSPGIGKVLFYFNPFVLASMEYYRYYHSLGTCHLCFVVDNSIKFILFWYFLYN